MNSITRHEIFGRESKPTVFYLVGFGGTISQLRWHTRLLAKAGLRVVAFEYDTPTLEAHPDGLLRTLRQISAFVHSDKQGKKVAGIYGISLGVWLGLNVLDICDIKSGYFVAGGTSASHSVWTLPILSTTKRNFIRHGFNEATLRKYWSDYEVSADPSKTNCKRLRFVHSRNDEVTDFNELSGYLDNWQKGGANVSRKIYKRLNHATTILRAMTDVRDTVKFFRI